MIVCGNGHAQRNVKMEDCPCCGGHRTTKNGEVPFTACSEINPLAPLKWNCLECGVEVEVFDE